MTDKQTILDTVGDLVMDFMYYDRKEDGELGVGDIEIALDEGVITIDELTETFKKEIEDIKKEIEDNL
jgi:hypothetical protein